MLSYHQGRIHSDYIPNLRASLKDYNTIDNTSSSGNRSDIDDELSVLRKLAFEVTKPGQTTIDRDDELVTTVYKLRMTKRVEEVLQSSAGSSTKAQVVVQRGRNYGSIYVCSPGFELHLRSLKRLHLSSQVSVKLP